MTTDQIDELRYAMHSNPGTGRNFEDIAQVLASWYEPPQSWDERNGVWLVEFADGARHLLAGWHDSSGWDCQSGLDLLPFEAWEQSVREVEYPQFAAPVEAVIASLNEQLAHRAAR